MKQWPLANSAVQRRHTGLSQLNERWLSQCAAQTTGGPWPTEAYAIEGFTAGPLPAACQQPPTTQIWLSTRCYCLFISFVQTCRISLKHGGWHAVDSTRGGDRWWRGRRIDALSPGAQGLVRCGPGRAQGADVRVDVARGWPPPPLQSLLLGWADSQVFGRALQDAGS